MLIDVLIDRKNYLHTLAIVYSDASPFAKSAAIGHYLKSLKKRKIPKRVV